MTWPLPHPETNYTITLQDRTTQEHHRFDVHMFFRHAGDLELQIAGENTTLYYPIDNLMWWTVAAPAHGTPLDALTTDSTRTHPES